MSVPTARGLFANLPVAALDRQARLLRAGDDALRAVCADAATRCLLFCGLRPLVSSYAVMGGSPVHHRLTRVPVAAVAAVGVDIGAASAVLLGIEGVTDSSSARPLVAVDVTPPATAAGVDTATDGALVVAHLRSAGFLAVADDEANTSYAFIDGRELIGASAWRQAHHAAPSQLPSGPLPSGEVALFGLSRQLLQWHAKSRFCGSCGSVMTPIEGGMKKRCTSCRDIAYPRTDPVVIALVTSSDGERALLSRQTGFPPGVYSCCAGYVEPGETLEEAVVRELREETSVELAVEDVRYFASQPWPLVRGAFGQIMVAATVCARADDGRSAVAFDTGELSDAKWFTRAEVRAAIEWHTGGAGTPSLRVPGPFAIAHSLLATWSQDT